MPGNAFQVRPTAGGPTTGDDVDPISQMLRFRAMQQQNPLLQPSVPPSPYGSPEDVPQVPASVIGQTQDDLGRAQFLHGLAQSGNTPSMGGLLLGIHQRAPLPGGMFQAAETQAMTPLMQAQRSADVLGRYQQAKQAFEERKAGGENQLRSEALSAGVSQAAGAQQSILEKRKQDFEMELEKRKIAGEMAAARLTNDTRLAGIAATLEAREAQTGMQAESAKRREAESALATGEKKGLGTRILEVVFPGLGATQPLATARSAIQSDLSDPAKAVHVGRLKASRAILSDPNATEPQRQQARAYITQVAGDEAQ